MENSQKSNKIVIVDFIILCLKKGEDRVNIMAKLVKKWQLSPRSFDRYLKKAKDEHLKQQELIKNELFEVDKQAAITALNKAILTVQHRKELLSKIATGQIKIATKEVKWNAVTKKFQTIPFIELPTHTARISAIAELNKMDGDYAPTKVAQTDSSGKDVSPVIAINQYNGNFIPINENEN
jgi:hypothetical protein